MADDLPRNPGQLPMGGSDSHLVLAACRSACEAWAPSTAGATRAAASARCARASALYPPPSTSGGCEQIVCGTASIVY